MSEEMAVLKVFNNEIDARMAQQILQDAGVPTFILKDDAGGMEPHLQRTIGVRLMVDRGDGDRARDVLEDLGKLAIPSP